MVGSALLFVLSIVKTTNSQSYIIESQTVVKTKIYIEEEAFTVSD